MTERVQLIDKYRLLAENASDIVCETDFDGVIKWMSPSAKTLGWDPEQLLGTSALNLIFSEDQVTARMVRRASGQGGSGC